MTEGMIQIDPVLCTGCKRCADNCPTHAIEGEQGKAHKVCEEKCVACGQCVQTCSAYDSVFDANLTPRDVLFKERCLPLTLTEPLFAAWDRNCLAEVKATLADAGVFPIVQCDSTVLSAIPEDFGYASGTLPPGRMAGALRKLGFRKVYNTNLLGAFAVREESHDLIERLQSGRRLPVIDSSCPAAVKYIEQAYPELIYHLTTCRSPQQIGGALYKSYGAKMWGVGPGSIYSVSVGPCTSRKLEAGRNTPRASLPASAGGAPLAALPDGKADLQGKSREADAVLTTRELAYLLKDAGVDPFAASSEEFDQDLLDRSWLSHVYCSTGDIA